MKVILLRDVAKLGKRFAIVETPDGYAQNKLIPQGLAQAATSENVKRVMARQDKQQADQSADIESFRASCAVLATESVTIEVDANEKDHLFQAVKVTDIAAALMSIGHHIPVESITVPEPIKALGTYVLALSLGEVKGTMTLNVIRKK